MVAVPMALDSRSSQTLLETFADLNRSMGATILMVTHDAFSASYCGWILFMSGRFVEATGAPVSPFSFFIKSVLLFFGIYLVYYAVTYISFIRNVDER